ncbi:MAG: hypothetical protein JKX76_01715 [Colwellia sp.]|nr:hypothetical protein [Colwellia sp.]
MSETIELTLSVIINDVQDIITTLIAMLLIYPDAFFGKHHKSHVLWLDNLVGEILELYQCGQRSTQHNHVMLRANSVIVYHTSMGGWVCDICLKRFRPRNVMYHCMICMCNICSTCFNISDQNSETPIRDVKLFNISNLFMHISEIVNNKHPELFERLALLKKIIPYEDVPKIYQPNMHVSDLDYINFAVVPTSTGEMIKQIFLSIRRRVMSLSLSNEIQGPIKLFTNIITNNEFAENIVNSRLFIPVLITGKRAERQGALGPFFRGTTMPDDPSVGNLYFRAPLSISPDKIQNVFETLRNTLISIQKKQYKLMKYLLTGPLFLQEATLSWIAVVTEGNAIRRQIATGVTLAASSDGFLVNLCNSLLQIGPEHESQINLEYFATPLNTRVAKWDPLVVSEESESLVVDSEPTFEMLPEYYPHWTKHFGINCDNCNEKEITGIRYKCACCEDYDLCGECFDKFAHDQLSVAHGNARLGQSSWPSEDDTPNFYIPHETPIHEISHVFIRINTCVPFFRNKNVIKLENTGVDFVNIESAIHLLPCTQCNIQIAQTAYTCSNCDMFVCGDCLPHVESLGGKPQTGHFPGHLFIELPHPLRDEDAYSKFGKFIPMYSHSLVPQVVFQQSTELFALTVRLLHEGPLHTIYRYDHLIKQFQRESVQPSSRDVTEQQIRLQSLAKAKFAVVTHIGEINFLGRVLKFYIMTARLLMTELDNSETRLFNAIPQHLIEDIAFFVASLPQLDAEQLLVDNSNDIEVIIILMARVISNNKRSSRHVRVLVVRALGQMFPYIKNNVPSSLYRPTEALGELFRNSQILQENGCFVRGLVIMYADMEHGTVDDRMIVRRNIALMLQETSTWRGYRKSFCRGGHINKDQYIKMVNCLLNDISYLLDEIDMAVTAWKESVDVLDNVQNLSAMKEEARELVNYNNSRCKQLARLLLETIHLLEWCANIAFLIDILFCDQLLSRTASILNYSLQKLTSEAWDDVNMIPDHNSLRSLVNIYLLLNRWANKRGVYTEFLTILGNNGRAINQISLARVTLLKKFAPEKNLEFSEMIKLSEEYTKAAQIEEDERGEPPSDLLDPIMNTLMVNPVTLPSGHVMDRSVIERHLLCDETNPFTREHLTKDLLVPNNEIKEKVNKWLE